MTEQELLEIEERGKEATASVVHSLGMHYATDGAIEGHNLQISLEQMSVLIAVREDVPELVAEVRRLQRKCAETHWPLCRLPAGHDGLCEK